MFERFTDRARRSTVLAQEEARALNHNYVGTEHILLGLIHEGGGIAFQALESLGLDVEKVRQAVLAKIGAGQIAPDGQIPFTPRAKKVWELSLREGLQLGHNYIGPEHLLLGLIREGEGVGAQILIEQGVELKRARQKVIQLLSGYANPALLGKVSQTAAYFVACSYCQGRVTGDQVFMQPRLAAEAAVNAGAILIAGDSVACTECQKRPLSEFQVTS